MSNSNSETMQNEHECYIIGVLDSQLIMQGAFYKVQTEEAGMLRTRFLSHRSSQVLFVFKKQFTPIVCLLGKVMT